MKHLLNQLLPNQMKTRNTQFLDFIRIKNHYKTIQAMKTIFDIVQILMFSLFAFSIVASMQVAHLDQDNFYQIVGSNQISIVNFYSPYCPLSENFMGSYEGIADVIHNLEEEFPQFKISHYLVNCMDFEKLCRDEMMPLYPNVRIYENGEKVEFKFRTRDRQASTEEILDWVRIYLGYHGHEIQSVEEVDKIRRPFIFYQGKVEQILGNFARAVFESEEVKLYYLYADLDQPEIKIIDKSGTEVIYPQNLQPSIQEINNWLKSLPIFAITPIHTISNDQMVLFNWNKPALVIVLTDSDVDNHAVYDMLDQICQEMRLKIVCGKVLENYDSFHGVHDFFSTANLMSFLGFSKDRKKTAFVYEKQYSSLTKEEVVEFIENSLNDIGEKVVEFGLATRVRLRNVPFAQSQEELLRIAKDNQFVMAYFYKNNDQSCKKHYQIFNQFVLKIVEFGYEKIFNVAINCDESKELCLKKKISSYPTLRMYIHQFEVEYPRTDQMPSDMDLISYVTTKMSATTILTHHIQTVNENPAVVFFGNHMTEEISWMPRVFQKYKCYFVHTEKEEITLEYHVDGEVIPYKGDMTLNSMYVWLQEQKPTILADMLRRDPDERIMKAMRNYEQIVILLDIEEENRMEYSQNMREIVKEHKICGAIASKGKQDFPFFMDWLGVSEKNLGGRSKVILQDSKNRKIYIFPRPLKELNLKSFQEFKKNMEFHELEKGKFYGEQMALEDL